MNEHETIGQQVTRTPDEYALSFFLASVEASWRARALNDGWDASRLNWPWLLWAAHRHHVLSGLARAWETLCGVPEWVRDEAWMAQELAEAHGNAVVSGIADIAAVARTHSLRLAVMKSPAFALDAFGSFRDRDVSDLDILADAEAFDVITRELCAVGYALKKLRTQKVFTRKSTVIEVHAQAINRSRYWRLISTRELLGRADEDPRWAPLLRLAAPDEALLFVLHARHHDFKDLLWLRDLAAWWRVRNPDPDAILDLFGRYGLSRTAWVAWRGMRLIGWNMPDSWDAGCWRVRPGFDRLAEEFWRERIVTSDTLRPLLLFRRLEMAEAEGLWTKCRTFGAWFSARRPGELFKAARNSMTAGSLAGSDVKPPD